jgi:DNA-binding response OmpR family regulator
MDLRDATDRTLPPLRGLPHGARALIVQDGPRGHEGRDALRPVLQTLGLEVFLAPDSMRATRILDRVPIDLLILILQQPPAESLLEWVRTVQKGDAAPALLAIVEQHHGQIEQQCDALGAAAYLCMPVSARTLRRCIEAIFSRWRDRQQIQELQRRLTALQAAPVQAAPPTTAGRAAGPDAEHQVDDLWFGIFEQLLGPAACGA